MTLEVEGTHCWPECPFEEVKFLKHPHRHLFKIKAIKEVTHDDRQIEIIMLKRKILEHLAVYRGDFGHMSCEMIAGQLLHYMNLSFCEVLEDGENGAQVIR